MNSPWLRLGACVVLTLAGTVDVFAQVVASVDVRRTVRQPDGNVDELKGRLLADATLRELRFESPDGKGFAIQYAHVIAAHLEDEKQSFLVVHYQRPDGSAEFATFRSSRRDVEPFVEAFAKDAGIHVQRSRARQSFLAVPIRAALGDRIRITERAGARIDGRLAHLSASSLVIAQDTGETRELDAESIGSIRHLRSRRADAARGLRHGAVWGALLGAGVGAALSAGTSGDSDSGADAGAILALAGLYGGLAAGFGAALGALLGSEEFLATRDVYLATNSPGASVSLVPRIRGNAATIQVSVRF